MSFEHYYTRNPKSKMKIYNLKEKVLGVELKLTTATGIYSPLNIDKGGIFQVKSAKIESKDKVLDLGCGYGTVGILIKKLYPKTNVYMTDINKRAINCAKKNIKKNKVKAKVFHGDAFENIKPKDFDVILFNPPINAGLHTCYRLIGGSFEHLKLGGTLQVVLRPREGGKSIIKKMKSLFGNAKRIGKKEIYEVWISKKETKEPVSEYNRKKAKQ